MRLKPTTTWLALSALLIALVLLLARGPFETGPIVSGRPMSHWLDVIEAGRIGGAEFNEARNALVHTTNRAALQVLVLDRIEAAYSPSAKFWHQTYISTPTWLRRLLPKPHFGHIQFQTVELLDGIMPEPSARQRAAIQTMLSFGPMNDADGAARLVALSTATQTVPESIASLRQQLAIDDVTLRLNSCEAIRAKYKFEGWSSHREAVAGLLADLRKLSTSDPDPDGRKAARQALDKLTFELGASESAAGKPRETKPESTLTKASLYETPAHPEERPLILDAPRAASELNFQLAPPAPAPGSDPFKP